MNTNMVSVIHNVVLNIHVTISHAYTVVLGDTQILYTAGPDPRGFISHPFITIMYTLKSWGKGLGSKL